MNQIQQYQHRSNREGYSVIICNLPHSFEHVDVCSLCKEFDTALSCCLSQSQDSRAALIQLGIEEQANQAVMALNATVIEDQKLDVALYPITAQWQAPDLVLIQYLPALYSLMDIQQLVDYQGQIEEYWWISSDYVNNVQTAVLRMKSLEQANAVMESLDQVFFIGCARSLSVQLINKFVGEDEHKKWIVGQEEWKINFEQSSQMLLKLRPSTKQKVRDQKLTYGVYVKNIPGKTHQQQYNFLVRKFSPFGTIANVTVLRYLNGKSFGYGFVDFYEDVAANMAIQNLNGVDFNKNVLKVAKSYRSIG